MIYIQSYSLGFGRRKFPMAYIGIYEWSSPSNKIIFENCKFYKGGIVLW